MECQGMGKDQEGRGRFKVNLRFLAEVTQWLVLNPKDKRIQEDGKFEGENHETT